MFMPQPVRSHGWVVSANAVLASESSGRQSNSTQAMPFGSTRSAGTNRDRSASLVEIGCDRPAGIDQGLHPTRRFLEHGAFGAVQLDLDDPLDPLGANHRRHAHIEVLH